MKYVSLFSGIEAASVAWEPLGWEPLAFSEIEKFPCNLLAQRLPNVLNEGDISLVNWRNYHGADVVIGGSPCQSFSVAGKRKGMDDERGLLMLEYVRAIREIEPKWFIWENVPGVRSSNAGLALGTLIWELEKLGYCMAWRSLDAQFYNLAQQRERVLLVGHSRAECAAAVLFDSRSLCWDFKTSEKAREAIAAENGADSETESECVTFAFDLPMLGNPTNRSDFKENSPTPTLLSSSSMYCILSNGKDITGPLQARDYKGVSNQFVSEGKLIVQGEEVRRLTPLECERLQGFPDNWTQLGNTADSPRYKALGNSMAVPVIKWLGKRIHEVDAL